MSTDPPADAVVHETVERALDPYRALLTPEMLEVFRQELTEALTGHPVGKTLTARLRERPPPERSGDVETPDGEKARDGERGASEAGARGKR